MKLVRTLLFCLALGGASAVAQAQDVRKTTEATMEVTGSVEVNPDGSLHGYVLDQPDKLSAPLREVIDKTMSRLSFDLSGPSTEVVKSQMNLRLLATPTGNGNFNVRVADAWFGSKNAINSNYVSYKDQSVRPRYPQEAINARASGAVYLMLRIGRDGTVQEAVAEQVNLDQYGSKSEMQWARKLLANASIKAAKTWTFNLPTQGKAQDDPYFVARVPVVFTLHQIGKPIEEHPYGSWRPYIPGPRETPPWISPALAAQAPDAVPDGALQGGDSGLRLKTPLSGS